MENVTLEIIHKDLDLEFVKWELMAIGQKKLKKATKLRGKFREKEERS